MLELLYIVAWLIFASLVVEAISEIITSGDIFQWLRQLFARLVVPTIEDDPDNLPLYRRIAWLPYKLTTCGYCCSVWVATACAIFTPSEFYSFFPSVGYLFSLFILHRLSNWWHTGIELFRRGRVNTFDITMREDAAEDDDG